jgi:predicted secreted hydrolase
MILVCSMSGVAEDDSEGYLQVTGPCGLEFPRDHAAHPGYRTEWWYYTGNLASEGGRLFGFQFTIFRSQISPPADEGTPAQPGSAWRTKQVYFGHLAISDLAGGRHWQAEEISRGALGMAGARQKEGRTRIWLHDWSVRIEPDGHHLSAETLQFDIHLSLSPMKPVVLHGEDGYSRKGSSAGRASCYYSFTRMAASGKLTIGAQEFSVRGQSWMDHEFSTALLEPGIVGWDWFSLQLSDNTEIMFFLLRTDSGGLHPASGGTFVDPGGRPTPLDLRSVTLTVLDRWKSPHTDAVYPSRWRLQVDSRGIDLAVVSNLADQEMRAENTTGTVYWEGSVSVDGRSGSRDVTGAGYMELTGYAEAFDKPL